MMTEVKTLFTAQSGVFASERRSEGGRGRRQGPVRQGMEAGTRAALRQAWTREREREGGREGARGREREGERERQTERERKTDRQREREREKSCLDALTHSVSFSFFPPARLLALPSCPPPSSLLLFLTPSPSLLSPLLRHSQAGSARIWWSFMTRFGRIPLCI